jgi:hypothetical protein
MQFQTDPFERHSEVLLEFCILPTFYKQLLQLNSFDKKLITQPNCKYKIAAHKMLMKLTPGVNFLNAL